MTIDHEFTDEIACPYCGTVFGDSWENQPGEEDLGLEICDECGKGFYATRNIRITYSTSKAKYGTCKKCGIENEILESYCSMDGSYDDYCIPCGRRAIKEFIDDYLRGAERRWNKAREVLGDD